MLQYLACLIIYRIYAFLPFIIGICFIVYDNENIFCRFACGFFWGVVIKKIYEILELIFFKVYSITVVSRFGLNKIHARIVVIEPSDLEYYFTKDLKKIKSVYNKHGIVLETDTHRLFVYHIIEEFFNKEIAKDLSKRAKALKLNEEISFESDDKLIKIVIKYYKDKVNTNTAIKKLIRFNSLKNDIKNFRKNIKKNSTEVKYYRVSIQIND